MELPSLPVTPIGPAVPARPVERREREPDRREHPQRQRTPTQNPDSPGEHRIDEYAEAQVA